MRYIAGLLLFSIVFALVPAARAQDAPLGEGWSVVPEVRGAAIWCDRKTGDLLVSSGRQVMYSRDGGETFKQAPKPQQRGRHWNSIGWDADWRGGRMALFAVDSPIGWMTLDGGRSWETFRKPTRPQVQKHDGWTFGAVDWSQPEPKRMLAKEHHTGNYWYSQDAGQSWSKLEAITGYLGIGFAPSGAMLMGKSAGKGGKNADEAGIYRSTDDGKTWRRVHKEMMISKVPPMRWDTTLYWPVEKGLLISKDDGKSWRLMDGSPAGCMYGPYFGASQDEMMLAGPAGAYRSSDTGKTWKLIVPIAQMPKPVADANFGDLKPNFAWDWRNGLLYATSMGVPLYKGKLPVVAEAGASADGGGADALVPGKLVVDPPTLICASFQWFGSGDANRNADCEVAYRKVGQDKWSRALNMYRLDKVEEGLPLLAGSVMDLEEDTAYEFRLTLKDPDGVRGPAQRVVSLRTWTEPMAPEKGNIRHVYPAKYDGKKTEPFTTTLKGALRGGKHTGRQRGTPAGAGDILLLHAGLYKGDPTSYRDVNAMHFTGSYYMAMHSGEAGKPLVIKPAGDGEVIIDGAGAHVLFDLVGARHMHFEGLTIRNCGIAFQLSDIPHGKPTSNITIKNCTIEDVRVVAYGGHPGNRRVYIGDNRFQGRQKAVIGSWGDFTSAAAVGLAGRGHVICYNTCYDFFDFFNNWGFYTGGSPAGRAGHADNSAVDVYNNYLERTSDNAVGMFPGVNLRCLRNYIVNHGDPALDTRNNAGPIYYVRNVVFNQRANRAFKTDGTIHGLYGFHNTITCYPANTSGYFRSRVMNNVFLGSPGTGRHLGRADVAPEPGHGLVLDYNAYRVPERMEPKAVIFAWQGEKFRDLRSFVEASGMETHGVTAGFGALRSAANVFELERQPPHNIHLVDASKLDLRPRPDSVLVDAGVVIPNVNEDYAGQAPDLGAYEVGQDLPHYGSRMKPTPPKVLSEGEGASADQIPADPGQAVMRINVGCPLAYEDPKGRRWLADQKYKDGLDWGWVGGGGTALRKARVAGTDLQTVYRYERYGMDAYRFDLAAGAYTVRLHFAEGFQSEAGRRVFDVVVDGRTVLEDLDIFAASGGKMKAMHRDVSVEVGSKGLTVRFVKGKDNPSLNGLEVFRR